MKKELFVPVCFILLFGLFASPIWSLKDRHELTLVVHPGTEVNISRTEASASKCTVCVDSENTKSCPSQAVLKAPGKVSVTFTCTEPWNAFAVEIIKKIECKSKPCEHVVTATDAQPLIEFNRTFHWCLRAPVRMTFHADFNEMGLTQINPSEACPDGHTYKFIALETTKNVHLGSYCAGGSISGIQILNGGKVALTVPRRETLEPQTFKVFWGEDIKSLAVVNVELPKKQSSQEFFSPNYPSTFPDDDLMTWNFAVPSHYEVTVKVLDFSEPHCRKKEPGLEYKYEDLTVVRKLSDPQPTGKEGSFAVSLRNCEMDVVRTRAQALGLALQFRVSAIRTGKEVSCVVDLSNENSLTLEIAKKMDSKCKMKLDGISKTNVIVPPGKKSTLSFRDCPDEDLLLTVNKTIGCEQLRKCSPRPIALTVPTFERCLPDSLKSVNWNLQAPDHGTVDLWAPYQVTLRQSLPGQECNTSVRFTVAESDRTTIGEFCPGGIISEVQVHGNVTVSASRRSDQFLPQNFQTFFKVSFSKEIPETYIFHINPKKDKPSLMATPGWPRGMKNFSTASWIAKVPEKFEAQLTFTEVKQPKCSRQHTSIRVRTMGSEEEMYSRREYEEGDREIEIPESFYLNMSNCLPERDSFSVMAEITLQKQRRILLPVILGVVGVLLVGMIIALVTVCVVIRKKKKQMNPEVSIYNPNGHNFLPGLHGPPKTLEDDEHIYNYIEDTLVYGHLLRDDMEMDEYGKPAVDTYRPFNGPSDTKPLKDPEALNGEPTKDSDAEVGVYRPFIPPSEIPVVASKPEGAPPQGTEAQPGVKLVDNELYSIEGGDGGSDSPAAPLSPCSEALQGPWI